MISVEGKTRKKHLGIASCTALLVLCFGFVGCGMEVDNESAADSTDVEQLEQAAPGTSMARQLYGDLMSFEADTLSGGSFTSADFANYEITMVNVWATTCPFCIEEMPGIELLYRDLPENTNLISICADGIANAETARAILGKTGCTFETLVDSPSLKECFLDDVTGVPTTVFVDKNGEIIGYPQVGAPTRGGDEGVAQKYRDLMIAACEAVA